MTVQNYISEGDKMLQIGVPVMCMRAVDKYIDANLLTEEGDPMKILLYSRIAVANFKIPKLERALAIAKMGLELCDEYQNNSLISMGDDLLNRLGKEHLIYVKNQVQELYDSLGTVYDAVPVDINEYYFNNAKSGARKELKYPDDLFSDDPISYEKAEEIFQIMNLPGDMVKVVHRQTQEVFGIQNGYLSSYSGDQDKENKILYQKIMNNAPADDISPLEYSRLSRYKPQDFLDAFEHYVRDNELYLNILKNFRQNKVEADSNYYNVYCQAFIEEFFTYFTDRVSSDEINNLVSLVDKTIIGSIKKIVGDLI